MLCELTVSYNDILRNEDVLDRIVLAILVWSGVAENFEKHLSDTPRKQME